MRFGVVILPEHPWSVAAQRVAARRGTGLRSRVDLRPSGLAIVARLHVVRRDPDAHRRRDRDGTHPPRPPRRVAELPPSGAVCKGADLARRHLGRTVDAGHRVGRRRLGRDRARGHPVVATRAGRSLRRVRRPHRSPAARAGDVVSRRVLFGRRRAHVPRLYPTTTGAVRGRRDRTSRHAPRGHLRRHLGHDRRRGAGNRVGEQGGSGRGPCADGPARRGVRTHRPRSELDRPVGVVGHPPRLRAEVDGRVRRDRRALRRCGRHRLRGPLAACRTSRSPRIAPSSRRSSLAGPARKLSGVPDLDTLERHPWNVDFEWRPLRGPFRRLSSAQAEQFDELGFVVIDDAVDPTTLARVTDRDRRVRGGVRETAARRRTTSARSSPRPTRSRSRPTSSPVRRRFARSRRTTCSSTSAPT